MISYARYGSFFSTHSFYEGVRITVGILVPILVATLFDEIGWGLAMAIGAMCISLTDNAGPMHHRINGMLVSIGFIALASVLVGLSLPYKHLLGILLVAATFFFSIIGVFGTRASSIGTAILIAFTLHLAPSELSVWENTLFSVIGGLWYFVFSITLYRIRPYQLAKQVLSDCMESTAKYLELKAEFYTPGTDFPSLYNQLLKQQVEVHHKQQVVRDVLFKTRSIIKESTHTGRVLVLSFLDTVDLFESVLTTERDYETLQKNLGDTGILVQFGATLKELVSEIEAVALALRSGKVYISKASGAENVYARLFAFYKASRELNATSANNEAYEDLKEILYSIRDLRQKIELLGLYTRYEEHIKIRRKIDYDRFVVPSYVNVSLLLENLNLQSNIFRYSLRMSASMAVGFLLSLFLPVGHGYWILLTIIVIIKPAYALTTKRNRERLLGTFVGGLAGALVLLTVQSGPWLLVLMIICMIGAYSLMRIRYAVSVGLITLYVLLAFYLLKPGDFTPILQDRIIDTIIASVIALLFTFVIPPVWERTLLTELLVKTMEAHRQYFGSILKGFTGIAPEISQYKWYRKETYVALANLSDAFQRMLNEPKSRQQDGSFLHPLVVSCHVFASRNASLAAYRIKYGELVIHPLFKDIYEEGNTILQEAEQILLQKKGEKFSANGLRSYNWFDTIKQNPTWSIKNEENQLPKGELNRAVESVIDQLERMILLAIEMRNLCVQIVQSGDKDKI